jgi:signal transduction histidine kinase
VSQQPEPTGGPRHAGRQAAALFAFAGVLAFLSVPLSPARDTTLLAIGIADLAVAAAAGVVPWPRLPRHSTLALALPGFTVLALSTWAFGGQVTGTAPFFLLLYVWVALHHPPWSVLAVSPIAAVAYVGPLMVTDQPPDVRGSAVIFLPVAIAVGLIIANRVRALRQARERVVASERWRAALVDALAHDVRGPLTSVHGALRLIREEPDLPPERRDRFVAVALRQTDRLIRLAGGLLDVGRVEQGVLRLDRREVQVRAAVEEALGYVAGHVDVDIDPALTVRADPERLQQILVNLTTNAMRHGEPPVVVTATRVDGQVLLAVRDHGGGVPEARRDGLFGRYSAVGPDRDSVGLGLWIVRELAEAHGGEVRYEPAAPGARFVVALPAPQTPQTPPAAEVAEAPPTAGGNRAASRAAR